MLGMGWSGGWHKHDEYCKKEDTDSPCNHSSHSSHTYIHTYIHTRIAKHRTASRSSIVEAGIRKGDILHRISTVRTERKGKKKRSCNNISIYLATV